MEALNASSFDCTSDAFSPVISTTRMSEGSPCRNPRPREKPSDLRAWAMIISPICSTALTSCSRVATVASIESRSVWKCRIAKPFDFGMSQSFKTSIGDRGEGAFRSDHHLRQIDDRSVARGVNAVDVVTSDAPEDFREASIDFTNPARSATSGMPR